MKLVHFLSPPLLVALCVLSLPATALKAQSLDEVPTVTDTYAIENARIVQAPGRVIERGTVVIRDGLIVTVGPDAEVPFDAGRIEGDSLTVYAGFIDGLSHAGLPENEGNNDSEDVERPGDPPPNRAGIQPDRRALALLNPEHGSIEALRRRGFTVSHVVPRGRMLPGTGALVLLGEADDADALAVRPEATLFAQLEGARGSYPNSVYPSTSMAVMAKLRQLYREAKRRQQLIARYEENPAGKERPPYDPEHTALFPVLDNEKPLFFQTEHPLEIFRVLDLQETLGFPLMLGGLKGVHLALEAVQQSDAPLFLTLDLPERPDTTALDTLITASDSAKAITPEHPGSFFKRDFRTISYEDTEAERKNLLVRRAMERHKYFGAADTLRDLGLRFGFSTMEAQPKHIRKNLRLMIEHGLSEEDALAALTVDPARQLGLDQQMGTVEAGKMANLVVTKGSYFEEDHPVRYVFVEGQKFEYEPGDEDEAPSVDPTGTWRLEADTPDGTLTATLMLSGSADDLDGRVRLPDGDSASLENVTLSGNELSFSVNTEQYGELEAVLTIRGDELDGTVTLPNGDAVPVTGTRQPE